MTRAFQPLHTRMPPRTDEHRAFGLRIAAAVDAAKWEDREETPVPTACLAYADWLREEQRWPGAADLVTRVERHYALDVGGLFALTDYYAPTSGPPAITLCVDPAKKPCRLTYTVNLLAKGHNRQRLRYMHHRPLGLARWVVNFCPDEAFEIVRGMPGCPGALKTLREIELYARNRTVNRRS